MRCSKCSAQAVTFIRYNGDHLCPGHFLEYVEKRVKKEVRPQLRLEGSVHIAVGSLRRQGQPSGPCSFCTRYWDADRDVQHDRHHRGRGHRGLPPSDHAQGAGTVRYAGHGTCHNVRSRRWPGSTLDDMVPRTDEKEPCSYCGVFRRRCMNLKAKELGADILAPATTWTIPPNRY